MSGFFKCPWCGYEMNGYDMFEDGGYHHFNCHSCHKPIVADVIVYFDVEIDKDKSAMMSELELYEKRMRGDWS